MKRRIVGEGARETWRGWNRRLMQNTRNETKENRVTKDERRRNNK